MGVTARRGKPRPDLLAEVSAPRYLVAAPAIRNIQRPNRSRRYARHNSSRRNVLGYDRSGRHDSVIPDRDAGKDCCRSTDPDVGSKTNWRDPGRARRFQGVVVGVKNGHQIAEPAIVTQYDAVIRHDRGTRVDEDALAEYEGATWAGADLDWDSLAAEKQTAALDRPGREDHRAPPIHSHEGGSRTCQSE